jgi:hypothetical protein
MKNGLPIDAQASSYVEEGFSAAQDIRRTGWNGCERDVDNVVITQRGNMLMRNSEIISVFPTLSRQHIPPSEVRGLAPFVFIFR